MQVLITSEKLPPFKQTILSLDHDDRGGMALLERESLEFLAMAEESDLPPGYNPELRHAHVYAEARKIWLGAV